VKTTSFVAICLLLGPLTAQDVGADRRVHLRFAAFDPAVAQPEIPAPLRGGPDTSLWIVQLDGLANEAHRRALRAAGAQVHGYLPENAYVVRMSHAVRAAVLGLAGLRSATYYHPAFRLEPELIAGLRAVGDDANEPERYRIVVVDKRADKPGLMDKIRGLGGRIDDEQIGSLLLEVSLTRAQLVKAARLDEVLWIDRWTPSELDMNNARIQGGANHVEQQTQGKYTGQGVNGHVYEGLEATHRDFSKPPINVRSGGGADTHGHCTAGIVFGNGTSHPSARGMAPDAQAHYTQYSTVQGSRWQVVETLVNTHQVMFTTASWGGARTRAYTSVSADTDDIIFDHDLAWTQSQSNAGNQDSRPEAWAKNIFSIGGVAHRDNANPLDDSWDAGNGSTGPAADGRIKPDLCAYYDGILCSDRTGTAGYATGDYYTGFGGTSGATPICAGHNAIAIQMFTDGLFSPQRVKDGSRWQNKPHFTTLKALQIANAAQYAFTSTSTDNRREHCGWGFPNLKSMYDNRQVHYVVDETDVLKQGEGMAYSIAVAPSQPELKVSLCYADPAGNPSATRTRINDLTLRVTAPDRTTRYWGNVGLTQGNYSQSGGDRSIVDTVENVFVQNPQAGVWTVEVGAFLVAQDSHVETTEVDSDYGLVAVGGTFTGKTKVDLNVGSFDVFGTGCPSASACAPCFDRNWTQTSANATTTAQSVALMDWTNGATTLCGLDLYFGARGAPVDVTVAIYDMNASSLPGRLLTSERIRVSGLQAYAVPLKSPVALGSGQIFFVVLDLADQLLLPVSTTGELRLHYEMRGNTWSTTLLNTTRWQYRVHCVQGNQVPRLAGSGAPTLGNAFRL
jgi:hypothetical protein